MPAIIEDLAGWRERTGPRRLTSIHFGGGTPSLMAPADIREIISNTDRLWGVSADIEIALEANPVDFQKFTSLKNAGITRLSLGVQSFHDPALQFLGRDHDGDTARKSVEAAMDLFPSVSLDLIFGWRDQSAALWQSDLDLSVNMGVQHISTYQLTIEENTAFARAENRGERKAVTDDNSANLYDQLAHFLRGSGFDHYEISNFARPGHRSAHNLAYWRGWDYAGIGPGAHGRLTTEGQRAATIAARRPDAYIETVFQTGWGVREIENLTHENWADEYVIMGLRITEGISLSRWAAINQGPLPDQSITDLIAHGFLAQKNDRLSVTEKGRPVLNRVTDTLLT